MVEREHMYNDWVYIQIFNNVALIEPKIDTLLYGSFIVAHNVGRFRLFVLHHRSLN